MGRQDCKGSGEKREGSSGPNKQMHGPTIGAHPMKDQ